MDTLAPHAVRVFHGVASASRSSHVFCTIRRMTSGLAIQASLPQPR